MNIFILCVILIFAIILWLEIYNTLKYSEQFDTNKTSPHMYLVVLDNHNMDINVIPLALGRDFEKADIPTNGLDPSYKLYKHPGGLVIGRKRSYNLDSIDIRWSRSNLIKKKAQANDLHNDIYIKVICPTQIKDKYRSIAIKDKVKYYSINCYKQI